MSAVITPGLYTPQYIIELAMKDAGKLQRGQKPDPDSLVEYMNRLNELCLAAQTQGLRLWLQFLLNIPLVAGKATYVISPTGDVQTQVSRIIAGYYLDSTGNQRPLISLAWDDWNKLSNKTQLGQINSYFQDKQANQINLSFWLTPDATAAAGGAGQMQVQQQQPTATTLTQNMQFPPEWGIWLHWALADQICTGQPQSIMDRCEKRAAAAFDALTDWDVEDAPTRFQPDVRGGNVFGRNR